MGVCASALGVAVDSFASTSNPQIPKRTGPRLAQADASSSFTEAGRRLWDILSPQAAVDRPGAERQVFAWGVAACTAVGQLCGSKPVAQAPRPSGAFDVSPPAAPSLFFAVWDLTFACGALALVACLGPHPLLYSAVALAAAGMTVLQQRHHGAPWPQAVSLSLGVGAAISFLPAPLLSAMAQLGGAALSAWLLDRAKSSAQPHSHNTPVACLFAPLGEVVLVRGSLMAALFGAAVRAHSAPLALAATLVATQQGFSLARDRVLCPMPVLAERLGF